MGLRRVFALREDQVYLITIGSHDHVSRFLSSLEEGDLTADSAPACSAVQERRDSTAGRDERRWRAVKETTQNLHHEAVDVQA